MIVICVILFIITIICLFLLFILNRDIKKFNEQIDYKHKSGSHFEVSAQSSFNSLKSLQQRINQLYDDIQNVEAKSLKKEKKMQTLMSGISHDIRTPLTSIQGYMKLMEESSDETERKKYQDIIEYRLETLKVILEDLFMHSKITDSEYTLSKENTEIFPVICKVLASFYYDFEKKGIEPVISFENKHLSLKINQELLTRMIQNLIQNALIYGGNYFEVKEQDGVISFINGIEKKQTIDPQRIFDRFYKGDTSRTHQSTGLGLSIVKTIADFHDWEIDAALYDNNLMINVYTKRR